MARGSCTFKQQDVTRALRATVAAGIEVKCVEIDKEGKIVIFTTKATEAKPGDLDKELADFEARHAD